MNMKFLKFILKKIFFPPRFENEKVENLYNFILQNNCDIEYWDYSNLSSDFLKLIQAFDTNDFNYFFQTIHLWKNDDLAVIAEKILGDTIKSNINYDMGNVYANIFLFYENLDSYCLIDDLINIITIYNSKLELATLINLTNKIKLLFNNNLISKEQFEYNLSFINNLK